jgi:hypothetical protein
LSVHGGLSLQHRIAAKVDELMALRDRLEGGVRRAEATRDRLAVASRYLTHPSNPAQQNQYKQDDDNDPDQADAVMTVTIAIAAKPAAKATKQKND